MEGIKMAKWRCSVCGYIHEGDAAPEKCPQCSVPAEKFVKVEEQPAAEWAAEHVIGGNGHIIRGKVILRYSDASSQKVQL